MFVEFFKFLNTLKNKNASYYLMLFSSTICSGLVVLIVYFSDLVINLDNYKIILLSLVISLPVLIVNILFHLSLVDVKDKEQENFEDLSYTAISLSCIITLLEIYFTIIVCYLLKIDFVTYLFYLISLVFLVHLTIKVMDIKLNKYKRLNKDQ